MGIAGPSEWGHYSPMVSRGWCHGGDYAFKISRLASTRSIKGRMPSSVEMAKDSSSGDVAFSRSPGSLRWSKVSA